MMDKNLFGSVLEHPEKISVTELAELSEAMAQCPNSTLLRTLVWMGNKACIPQFQVAQSQLDLYLLNPTYVASRLATISAASVDEVPAVAAQLPPEDDPQPTSQEDIMNEINAYHDVSFKTAPKSVILSNFLETANCNIDELGPAPTTPVEELAKKSISADESLCTETLAVVLEKQGKFEKAMAIYEKLMCKYPEKSSTFANRIEILKSKIDNK